ncbi:MAG TPA: TraR/DksA family transcriptional regulator [Anaerolineae bacterium]|nr:TraR/DksA family transcriptional regulator [Anaerolineae bacterium]HMR63519.1 TraR/DksA family transcriptional regulator [Anaerolineae bacterium]
MINMAPQVAQLKKERQQIRTELEHLRELIQAKVSADIGQGDPKEMERDLARSLILVHERKLAAIEQALKEAERGQYGICERCGQPIDPERLEAVPEATLCITCKQLVEKRGHR